jgi:hypothetical protein
MGWKEVEEESRRMLQRLAVALLLTDSCFAYSASVFFSRLWSLELASYM